MGATRALIEGKWQKAVEVAQSMDVWRLLPTERKEAVLAMLSQKIQEEALRTYLFVYSAHYAALSLDLLVQV